MSAIVEPVVREHAELAAFQWVQRAALMLDDPPDPEAVAFVDARLAANVDALRIAGAAAWPAIVEAFEDEPGAGRLFVLAVRALEAGDRKRLDQAVAFARSAEDGPRGLCGAFAWLPPQVTAPVVREWVDAANPVMVHAALSALSAHGSHPGDRLERLLRHQDPEIRSAAERFHVGET